jgi:hypothetical protein
MDAFKGSPTSLVATVDCTASGKKLCQKHSVGGYPTLLHGDPSRLIKYEGEHSYDDLKKFADEHMAPKCHPDHLNLCSDEQKKQIQEFQAMSAGKLAAKVGKAEKDIEQHHKDYDDFLKKVKKDNEIAFHNRDKAIKDIKEVVLNLMKLIMQTKSDAKKEL